MDTYYAPYKVEHRYWTGLLLLLRCALFLVFAFNINGDDSINLLVTCSSAFGIFIWFALSGMVYKIWKLNALELSFILNLGVLSAATFHVKLSGGSQTAVAYTSVGTAFLTCIGIFIYHINIRIKSKVHSKGGIMKKNAMKIQAMHIILLHTLHIILNFFVTNCNLHSFHMIPSQVKLSQTRALLLKLILVNCDLHSICSTPSELPLECC